MHALCASRVCSLWLSSLALSLTRAHTTPRPSFTHSLALSDPRSLVPLHKSPVGDWLEHRQDPANEARANLKHVRERELTRRNHTRRPATFKVRDLELLHQSRLPTWPRNRLQDSYFGPYRIMTIDGSRIHVTCSLRLGGELLCAPKQLRHYHLPDELSWDEWRLSDREVERIDLEKASNPEEADKLEEMTADEMTVHGYYVVAGIARHEYKQGWKFLILWDGYAQGWPESLQAAVNYFASRGLGRDSNPRGMGRRGIHNVRNLLDNFWPFLVDFTSKLFINTNRNNTFNNIAFDFPFACPDPTSQRCSDT